MFILFALFFSVYTVLAQTSSHKDLILVEVNPEQLDYEGYLMLDMDKDSQLTEEDLYLKLELINEQVANTSSSLKYISTTYNMTFRLTPLATNLAIKNSASNNPSINFNNIKGATSFKSIGRGGIVRRGGKKK